MTRSTNWHRWNPAPHLNDHPGYSAAGMLAKCVKQYFSLRFRFHHKNQSTLTSSFHQSSHQTLILSFQDLRANCTLSMTMSRRIDLFLTSIWSATSYSTDPHVKPQILPSRKHPPRKNLRWTAPLPKISKDRRDNKFSLAFTRSEDFKKQ